MERDIAEQLALASPLVLRRSIARPNLHFSVARPADASQKLVMVEHIVAREQGSGLVYTATIKSARALHAHLLSSGVPAGLCHGQLIPPSAMPPRTPSWMGATA